jgi:phosphatidate cytidylyltransferase
MGAKRLVAAAVFLPLFILYVMKLPPFYFLLLAVLAAAIAQSELYAMYKLRGILKHAGVALGTLMIAVVFLKWNILAALALSFMAITAIRLFGGNAPSSALRDSATALFGILYIPVLLGYQLNLRAEGPEWIVLLYGTVWISDAAAYYTGKSIGKRKLFESISPNKTVAGGVGSLAGGMAGALIMRAILMPSLALPITLAAGAITGVVTVIGDLVESMLKRDAGVKDSSTIIPGHGGVLDKLDGALFVGPALFWFFTATGAFG